MVAADDAEAGYRVGRWAKETCIEEVRIETNQVMESVRVVLISGPSIPECAFEKHFTALSAFAS